MSHVAPGCCSGYHWRNVFHRKTNLFSKVYFLCAEAMMMVPTRKARCVPDPTLGVGDLMKALRADLAHSQNWDLWQKLSHPNGQNAFFSWKTAPNPTWMAQCADLMCRFASLAPNGLLLSSKLKVAILKLHYEKKINFSKYHEEVFADKCDYRIRCLLHQFRSVKQKKEEYYRCMRKASEAEQQAIDQVLEIMHLAEEDDNPADLAGLFAGTEPPAPPPSGVLVADPREKKAGSSAGGIFARIEEKKDSDESVMEQKLQMVAVERPSPAPVGVLAFSTAASSSSARQSTNRKAGKMRIFPESEEGLDMSPVQEKKKKKQGADLNPKKKKQKKEAAPVPEEALLSEDDLETIDQALVSAAGCKPKKR